MKRSLLPLAVLGWVACSRGPTLLVTVENIPNNTQSLDIVAAHSDVGTQKVLASIKDIEPLKLSSPAAPTSTFLLRLPGGFSGDINISVGAFVGDNASGCLVATGNASQPMFVGRDETLRVPLDPFMDMACSGKKPMLTAVNPGLGSTAGGEKVVLSGWGFKPGASVTMGSKPATNVTFKSSSLLEVTTPSKAGFGLTNINVVNPDMRADSRKDLFRFFTPSLDFKGFPFANSGPSISGGLVISKFDPRTSIDAAVTDSTGNKVRVLFTVLQNVVRQQDIPVGQGPGPIVSADFDKDQDNDIIVSNTIDGTIQLLKNDGMGVFQAGPAIAVGLNPAALAVGDFDGDGSSDLVVANQYVAPANGELTILLNDGAGNLTVRQNALDVGVEPVGLAIGDFNTDGLPDIAVANRGTEAGKPNDYRVTVMFNQGKGVFSSRGTAALGLPVCKEPTSVLVKDVNGNGKDDLLVSCTGENKVQIWMNMGGLNIAEVDLITDARPRALALADLNGDGFDDLIVPCDTANNVHFFLNQRGAGFEGATPIKRSTSPCNGPFQVALVDVDGDGKSDIGAAGNQCIAGLFNQSM
ncbi:MAG: VCBS repeat-containing protein [Myxococcales bacterium]|nr:VCBS repeat-containing protein [Myxococcales bacterium]